MKQVFREEVSEGGFPGPNHWAGAGMYLLDSTLLAELHENGNLKLVSIDPNLHDRVRPNVIDRFHEKLAAAVGNPFRETLFGAFLPSETFGQKRKPPS
jgi:hypothetical protein